MAVDESSTGPTADDEWARWRRDIFGDPYLVWHDGPDFTALLNAGRSDPETVTRMLAAGVHDGDPLAAQSFTVLSAEGLAPDGARALLHAAVGDLKGSVHQLW
jgi:hypothetical protein